MFKSRSTSTLSPDELMTSESRENSELKAQLAFAAEPQHLQSFNPPYQHSPYPGAFVQASHLPPLQEEEEAETPNGYAGQHPEAEESMRPEKRMRSDAPQQAGRRCVSVPNPHRVLTKNHHSFVAPSPTNQYRPASRAYGHTPQNHNPPSRLTFRPNEAVQVFSGGSGSLNNAGRESVQARVRTNLEQVTKFSL